MFSGSMDWGDTTDIRPESGAQIIAPYNNLPIADNTYDYVIADPFSLETLKKAEDMNKTVEHQTAITKQVQANIVNISKISESTAQDAAKTSAQGDEIVQLALNLDKLLKQFKFN